MSFSAFASFNICDSFAHVGQAQVRLVGQPCLEDTMLAGAFVEVLSEKINIRPNDSARLALP